MRPTLAILLSTLLGCTGGKTGKTEAASHPMARKPAPAIEVKLADGASFRPDDARGKVLVLDFWATWCAPCKASFPKVDAIYKKHAGRGLEVVAINEDEEPNKVPAFVSEVKPTFTTAYDNAGKAAEAFGVETMPSSFIIDRRGVVRYAHSGYHPDDAAVIESEIEELLAEAP